MTVQMTSAVSAAFSYSSRQNTVQGSEQSFDSLLKTGADSSVNTEKSGSQIADSGKQKVTKLEKQEPTEAVSKRDTAERTETVNKGEPVETAETCDTVAAQEAGMVSETDEEQLPEEILSEILSILNEFVTVLQDHLQTDMQQLTDAAESIQFGVVDCFDADRIKDLFLQVNNVDASELLTDENLYKSLEQLQNLVNDILENSDLYQLLQQEGFEPEGFELQAFSEQITEFISQKLQPEQMNETAEVVIEFDNDVQMQERPEAEVQNVTGTEADGKIAEYVGEEEAGLNGEEPGQYSSERNQDQAGLFLQKLVSVAKEQLAETVQNVSGGFELYDIAAQIIEQVKLQIRPENTKMELQLNPENLGKVELEITSKNGELSAKLNVRNDQVKEAVESQMQVLRDTLEAQGLKVENIEVTVAEFGFRFQDDQGSAEQFSQQQRRNGTIRFEESETEEQSFSDVSEVMKELNGNSVDYVA